MIKKSASPIPGHVRITFELPASMWADHVFLSGDFNNWDSDDLPMQQKRDGVWRTSLDLCAGQFYEFRYVIDGQWHTDYHADGFSSNQHGAHNSIVNASLPVIEQQQPVPTTVLPRHRRRRAEDPPRKLHQFRPRTPTRSVA